MLGSGGAVMQHTLQLNVPIMNTPPLTSACSNCGIGHGLLSIVVGCNTPEPFQVKDWRLNNLPVPQSSDDTNEHIRGETISAGDTLFFTFPCIYSEATHDEEASLAVIIENDAGGSFVNCCLCAIYRDQQCTRLMQYQPIRR